MLILRLERLKSMKMHLSEDQLADLDTYMYTKITNETMDPEAKKELMHLMNYNLDNNGLRPGQINPIIDQAIDDLLDDEFGEPPDTSHLPPPNFSTNVAGGNTPSPAPIISSNFQATTIPSVTKPDILYFDSATKRISYGAVPAAEYIGCDTSRKSILNSDRVSSNDSDSVDKI